MLEGLGIGERLGILDGFSMHDGANGKFDDLAAFGSRNLCNGDDLRRHMPRRRVGTNNLADSIAQLIVNPDSGPQDAGPSFGP